MRKRKEITQTHVCLYTYTHNGFLSESFPTRPYIWGRGANNTDDWYEGWKFLPHLPYLLGRQNLLGLRNYPGDEDIYNDTQLDTNHAVGFDY